MKRAAPKPNGHHDAAEAGALLSALKAHGHDEPCELPTLQEAYVQRVYEAQCGLNIHKDRGGNRDQTLTDIRGIPGVTIVSVVPGTTRELPHTFITTLSIKFVLSTTIPPRNYIKRHLMPGMQKILGISNFQIKSMRELASGEEDIQ